MFAKNVSLTSEHDYLGRRISKTDYTLSPIRSTLYCYDGDGSTPSMLLMTGSLTTGQIVAEYDGNGTLLRKFIYGSGVDEPICMITAGGTKYYYHFDGLGSVVALSDSTGSIVEKYSYDVFGMPTIRDAQDAIRTMSAFGNPFMFTGREYDTETGIKVLPVYDSELFFDFFREFTPNSIDQPLQITYTTASSIVPELGYFEGIIDAKTENP